MTSFLAAPQQRKYIVRMLEETDPNTIDALIHQLNGGTRTDESYKIYHSTLKNFISDLKTSYLSWSSERWKLLINALDVVGDDRHFQFPPHYSASKLIGFSENKEEEEKEETATSEIKSEDETYIIE